MHNKMRRNVRDGSLVLLLSLVVLPLYGIDRDVQTLVSTERECVFRFVPEDFRLDSVYVKRRLYRRAGFQLADPTGEPGEPEIPSRIVLLGVPTGGDVRISIVKTEFTEYAGIRPVPVPRTEVLERFPAEHFNEGPQYGSTGILPESVAEVGVPEMAGSERMVRVRLFPVQFDIASETVRIYSEIVIRVEFGGRVESRRSVRRERKSFLDRLIINPGRSTTQRSPVDTQGMKMGLQTGHRFKIFISSEGLYRITGSTLAGLGVDIGSIDPSTLKIFNNGGRELPRELTSSRSDALIENPVLLFGMDDGRFDASDALIFYGKGVRDWEFVTGSGRYAHTIHHYDQQNVYWLVFGDGVNGRRMEWVSIPPDGAIPIDEVTDRIFYEQDRFNILKGGIQWYADRFDNQTSSKTLDVVLSDPLPGDTLHFRFQFRGETSGAHRFYIHFNNQPLQQVTFSGTQLKTQEMTIVQSAESQNDLELVYSGSGVGSTAYLDWYEIEYERSLRATPSGLRIFAPRFDGLADLRMSGFSSEPFVIDVTDFEQLRQLEVRSEGNAWGFVDSLRLNRPRRYFAAVTPVDISASQMVEAQNPGLRTLTEGGDMIIITPALFREEALRLKTLREETDSLSVFIADIDDIYDEFSWGLVDPTAIRDFIRFAFSTWNRAPSYLLLLGDGDYDTRNILQPGENDHIPPFEYSGSTESSSRASDDWYGYVSGVDNVLDLAVGRIPAQTAAEASVIVDKIIAYETDPDLGDWRSLVTMVGDDEKAQVGDENETTHTRAAEDIAEEAIPDRYHFRKIYLSEYPEVIQIGGRRKPQARDDLIEQINRGTIVVNFVGHGNEQVWAHERIFEQARDLPLLENGSRYPFFYAATCAFARYDDPLIQSFSEDLLRAEGRGGIAVIAASRFCSASPNEALNKAFMTYLFSEDGPTLRLGDALRAAKLVVSNRVNNEMYHILGDPAMRLSVPRYRTVFTQVEPDTLKALGLVRVEGRIEKDGSSWSDFDGEVGLKVFNAKKDVTYQTQYGTPLRYTLPGNAIFRGETRADEGTFAFEFVVPKDISYGQNSGRLQCYFDNGESDGGGYRDGIEIGGTSDLLDAEGPEIVLVFTGRENFITGEMVDADPELVAVIKDDKSGVNITGEIGHTIQLSVDGSERIDLTEYFQYDEGSYLEGRLKYRLSGLTAGEHMLNLKAWDNANNSATHSIMFEIVPEGDLRIEDVLNYPNPFETQTVFTFKLNRDARAEIKIYTLDGRMIRRLDPIPAVAGFNMISWDGRDDMGDELANGVYLYKVFVSSWSDGEEKKQEVLGRLMIFR